MIPSLERPPTKAKEAPSPHEVRLTQLDTNPVFQCVGGMMHPPQMNTPSERLIIKWVPQHSFRWLKYLYTAYADDNTFFLKNNNSISQLKEHFSTFSTKNVKLQELDSWSVKIAVYGMKCVDLCTDTIRITGECITKPHKMRKNSWRQ